jgi:hypothetical protein
VAYKNLTEKQVSQTGKPEPEDQKNSQGIGSPQLRKTLGKTVAKHRVEDELKNLQDGWPLHPNHSEGNVYTSEVDTGKRVQKFVRKK